MVQTVKIGLVRNDRQPWGFRLHGGAEYGSPLVIQKVNDKSISEHAGLKAGDVVIAVNGNDVTKHKHKQAQDMILQCGNSFSLSVQRGGLFQEAIKTQLTASHHSPRIPSPQPPILTETDHAAPSQGGGGGGGSGFTTVPHHKMATYNSPHKLYSEETMKEAANTRPDPLVQGVKSMGFTRKCDKSLQDITANSQVLKALQEQEAGFGPNYGVAGMSELQEDRKHHPNETPKSVFRAGGLSRPQQEQPRAPWQRPLQPQYQPLPAQAHHAQQPAGAWNTNLNNNKAGGAANAEDFTKQFMKDTYQPPEPERAIGSPIPRPGSGMRSTPTSFRTQSPMRHQSPAQSQLRTQSPAFKQIHQQQQHQDQPDHTPQAPTAGWDQTLNDNKSGMAGNAEDFTKQFMSDMYGSQNGQQSAQVQWQPQPAPVEATPFVSQPMPTPPQQPMSAPAASSILKTNSGSNMNFSSSSSSSFQQSQSSSSMQQQSSHSNGQLPGVRFQTSQPQPQGPASLPQMSSPSMPMKSLPGKVSNPKATLAANLPRMPGVGQPAGEPAPPAGPGQSIIAPRRGRGHLVCEACYGQFYAPECEKCRKKILGVS
eukprot:maker-scaffold1506_size38115-snap-gene-0.5 protein:Tk07867 transcript:maker-scaffold1506_size38115-snap-gene-0.5-mRNA-1 annotation:"isoform e"